MVLEHWLILSGILFSIGLAVVLTRRNMIFILMGIELMLNAANVNLIAFNRWHGNDLDAQVMVLMIIVVAAAEIAVALAIVLQAYREFNTLDLDKINKLKG
ncbi:MAG: NADH-quinone oxidoreductase subunit NuoK [Candidatus Cyclobacteriaceae bacterium M2_1C_046]